MSAKRTFVLALAAAFVVGALVILLRATTEASESSVAVAVASHGTAMTSTATPTLAPAQDLSIDRSKAAAIVDPRIDAIRSESDLLHYFDLLEADARARGHLDDELARADLAGKKLLATMPKEKVALRMFDFADRMRHVAVDMRVTPVLAQLDGIRVKLAGEHDPAKRQALLQQYGQLSAKLDVPTARLAASERLKATLAAN